MSPSESFPSSFSVTKYLCVFTDASVDFISPRTMKRFLSIVLITKESHSFELPLFLVLTGLGPYSDSSLDLRCVLVVIPIPADFPA